MSTLRLVMNFYLRTHPDGNISSAHHEPCIIFYPVPRTHLRNEPRPFLFRSRVNNDTTMLNACLSVFQAFVDALCDIQYNILSPPTLLPGFDSWASVLHAVPLHVTQVSCPCRALGFLLNCSLDVGRRSISFAPLLLQTS